VSVVRFKRILNMISEKQAFVRAAAMTLAAAVLASGESPNMKVVWKRALELWETKPKDL
jgi:hypothetical protein